MWNLKITTNKKMLFTKQKEIHRHRKQTVTVPKGRGKRDKLGVWN